MNYVTHSLGGVAAGMIVISAVNIDQPVQQSAIIAGATLGALFIDIDHRQSWIGHKFPIIAEVMSGIFKHRGPIHTPSCILAVSLILGILDISVLGDISELVPYFIKGFIPGMFSHIILDTLNVQGIMWIWPLSKKRFHLLPIRTNSIGEVLVCGVMALCIYGKLVVL
ncbi:MAG: metal-dependent hydrolase [Aminipila sp.]